MARGIRAVEEAEADAGRGSGRWQMMVTYMDSRKDVFDDSPASGPKVDLESFSQALQRRDLLAKVYLLENHSRDCVTSAVSPAPMG
jgi:hypothetical protein